MKMKMKTIDILQKNIDGTLAIIAEDYAPILVNGRFPEERIEEYIDLITATVETLAKHEISFYEIERIIKAIGKKFGPVDSELSLRVTDAPEEDTVYH